MVPLLVTLFFEFRKFFTSTFVLLSHIKSLKYVTCDYAVTAFDIDTVSFSLMLPVCKHGSHCTLVIKLHLICPSGLSWPSELSHLPL